MKTIAERVTPKNLTVLASAEFTPDMAKNLVQMCAQAREGECVVLQICNWGVWAVTSHGIRMFIGSTREFRGNADQSSGLQ
jgi:hypothetical protein